MTTYDIIPDIHGQAGLLTSLLRRLGYSDRRGAWRHPDRDRSAIFLGDFIDRGPDQAATIDIVRRMTGEGTARAVMGNHELNALLYHATDPATGRPLRAHGQTQTAQHARFLSEFPLGMAKTRDVLSWMAGLPLWLEMPEFRAVHACWHAASIALIRQEISRDGLDDESLLAIARKGDPLRDAVENLLKGPEIRLPPGVQLVDNAGYTRSDSRVAWWTRRMTRWHEVVASWPEDQPLRNRGDPRATSRSQLPQRRDPGLLRPLLAHRRTAAPGRQHPVPRLLRRQGWSAAQLPARSRQRVGHSARSRAPDNLRSAGLTSRAPMTDRDEVKTSGCAPASRRAMGGSTPIDAAACGIEKCDNLNTTGGQ